MGLQTMLSIKITVGLFAFSLIVGGLELTYAQDAERMRASEQMFVPGADPTVIVLPADRGEDWHYYAFVTGRGIPILRSRDLRRWDSLARVFDQLPDWLPKEVPGVSAIWAPDISYHDGLFYLYYAASTFGSQRSVIGLVVNKSIDPQSPDYRWEDRGKVVESFPGQSDYNAIDPALFVDRDGKWYLFFGSFWSGIKAIDLTPGVGKPPKDARIVSIAARPHHPSHAIEAPFVVFRDGLYYLFVSWDRCCDGAKSDYKVAVGRSKHVLGPYNDADGRPMLQGGGKLILTGNERWRGPGHNCVIQVANNWWFIHHTYDMQHLSQHRILQVRPMTWSKDGWPQVGEPLVE